MKQPTLPFDENRQLKKGERIVLQYFPVPPSSNKIYKHFYDKRYKKIVRASSDELLQYKKHCEWWANTNRQLCERIHLRCRDTQLLKVTTFVCLHEDTIFTKDGKVRQMDVSNRGKALYDCLSKAIGVDDRHFVDCTLKRVLAERGQPESCVIVLEAAELPNLQDVLSELKTANTSQGA